MLLHLPIVPSTPGVGLDNRAFSFIILLMPLRKINFIRENFYHIFNRGDRKELIFRSNSDYDRFLLKTEEYRKKYSIDIVAYCLLPNHFHLLVKQLGDIPCSKFIGVLLNSYARFASVRHALPPGHLFQGRFGATHIESPESLLQVSRYVHLNPVKEKILGLDFTYKKDRILLNNKGIIIGLRSYPWSSYLFYLHLKKYLPILNVAPQYIWELGETLNSYRRFVESPISDEDVLELERY